MSVPKRGRPSKYTEAIAEEICARLAKGESLRSICRDAHMPSDALVQEWVRGEGPGGASFVVRYARAREQACELMADELVEISDSDCTVDGRPDNALVQQARLRVDTRKWLLSKMVPRRYGDRITAELTSDPDAPLIQRIELVPVDPVARPKADLETARVGEVSMTPLRVIPSR